MNERHAFHAFFALLILVFATVACGEESGRTASDEFLEPTAEEEVQELAESPEEATSVITSGASTAPPSIETPITLVTDERQPTDTPSILLRVIYASINVREGPGTNYKSIAFLYEDDTVQTVETSSDGSWYRVQLEDGTEGWVSASVVEASGQLTDNSLDQTGQEVLSEETQIPTPEFTATPTPPLYVEIIHTYEYIDYDGDLWLYGEVSNLGTVPAKDIELTTTFYDKDGAVTAVKTNRAGIPLDFSLWHTGVLHPGELAPFEIYVEEPGNYDTWKLTVNYVEALASDYAKHYSDLRILNDKGSPIDSFLSNYRVSGEIENVGEHETGSVRIVVTLYDEEGRVVGVEELGSSEFETLAPGQITPFSVEIYARRPVASYRLFIRSVRH